MSQSGHLTRLEPDDAKVSRPVLRGGGGGNTASLPGNAADQLVTARSSADGIVWHYTFDDRGSLLRQTPGGTAPADGEIRYSYDAAGQLVEVELYVTGDYTTLATADYNGRGERARLTTWAAGTPLTITYVLAHGPPLVADDGSQATRYLYGRGLVAEHETAWVYDLLDGAGSVRLVVDESGAITLTRAYKPFGGLLVQSGGYETAFGYLGAQLDRVSGLVYVGGRYYDPATGRFLTPARGPLDPYHPRRSNPYVPWQGLWLVLPVALLLAAAYKSRKRPGRKGPWLLLLLAVMVTGMGVAGVLVACGPPITPTPDPNPTPGPTLPGTPELPTQPPTPEPTPVPVSDADLLKHSVRVGFYKPWGCYDPANGNPPATVCPDLHGDVGTGTLITLGSRPAVLTHNHYDEEKGGVPEGTTRVWLYSKADKSDLVDMSRDEIILLPAKDPSPDLGTLVFYLPQDNGDVNRFLGRPDTLSPAVLGDPNAVAPGSEVQAVLRSGDRSLVWDMEVLPAWSGHFRDYEGGAPYIRLHDEHEIVQEGDSGGGVFYGGNLVGNIWSYEKKRRDISHAALLPNWVLAAAVPGQ